MRLALALTAATLTSCTTAPAFADKISISLGSYHPGAHNLPYNEENFGVFYTKENALGDFDVTFGIYDNSYNYTSSIATVSYDFVDTGDSTLGLFAGAAHYPKNGLKLGNHIGRGWVLVGGLQVSYGNLFAQVMPTFNKEMPYVATFGLTVDIGG